LKNADNCTVGTVDAAWGGAFYAGEPAQAVEVTEEFVSAVDEMHDHFGSR
jgi:hypothetical protein